MTMNIGKHIKFNSSISKSLELAIKDNLKIIQLFLGNPKSLKRSSIIEDDIEKSKFYISKYKMTIFSHFPYIANLCGKSRRLAWTNDVEIDIYVKYVIKQIEYELNVISSIDPSGGVVIHPGSHPNKELGLVAIAKSINRISFPKNSTILLENSANEGNKLCGDFDQIGSIISSINLDKRRHIGVCVDTAHVFGSGIYDLRSIDEIDRMLFEFDQKIGLKYLKLLHLNDSKVELGSRKDRHELIGHGKIWKSNELTLIYLIEKMEELNIPIVLETGLESKCREFIEKILSGGAAQSEEKTPLT